MDGNFYVYRHIRLDKNEPFYIGIAQIQKRDRGYYRANRFTRRNPLWTKIYNKTECRVEIILDNLSQREACEKEKELILLYGKIINKTGTLSNITDGGEGVWGLKMSEKSKQKIRLQKIGFRHSDETKEKIRVAGTGRLQNKEAKEKIRIAQIGNTNGSGERSAEFKVSLSKRMVGV